MTELKLWHLAWLETHTERSELWLRERLADGFDVHHIDGDKENNDPSNLVLIEAADHMMLHNGSKRVLRSLNRSAACRRRLRVASLPDGTYVRLFPKERARTVIRECVAVGVPPYRIVTAEDEKKYRLIG